MGVLDPQSDAWLASVQEDVIDPDRVIIDRHHHLRAGNGPMKYGVAELLADVSDGHRVKHTVFMECHSS